MAEAGASDGRVWGGRAAAAGDEHERRHKATPTAPVNCDEIVSAAIIHPLIVRRH